MQVNATLVLDYIDDECELVDDTAERMRRAPVRKAHELAV